MVDASGIGDCCFNVFCFGAEALLLLWERVTGCCWNQCGCVVVEEAVLYFSADGVGRKGRTMIPALGETCLRLAKRPSLHKVGAVAYKNHCFLVDETPK